MKHYLSEAGDPSVSPRPEYVAGLRAQVLDRLGPPRKSRPWTARLLVGSGLAALAVAAAVVALSRPVIAWAQVAEALRGRPWVHSKTVGPDGKALGEAWFSPKGEIVAFRHGPEVEYHDYKLRVFTKYVPSEGTVYRLPENRDQATASLSFYRQLLDDKRPAKSPFPGMEVVKQTRRDVEEGGRRWQDIELTLSVIGNPARELQRMTLRVDPATRLPESWAMRTDDGQWATTTIDYPDTGPADIHDLGAPRTAKVVDRIPGDDLDRVLAGLKAGRNRFDDYRALVVWGSDSLTHDVKRVWRKGRKWRVEQLLTGRKSWPSPDKADVVWWKEHEGDYVGTVQAICDGEKIWYYRLKDGHEDSDVTAPSPVTLTMTQAVNPSDDPMMPWPHLMPEQLGHPAVWQPSRDREFLLDPKPDDGPPGTVRLRVRDSRSPEPGHPDLYKLWIKPGENYVSMRSEASVFASTTPPKIEYIDTQIVEALARSPGGYSFPARVRRKTSNFKGEQVTNFYLEFGARIPEELFRPLK